MKKAIVLLSGGLDSTTTLYWAKNRGYECIALTFDYGQRHKKEITHAKRIARLCKIKHILVHVPFPKKSSSLLDKKKPIPTHHIIGKSIPSTYVPARNSVFLTIAASYAEAFGVRDIVIGANSLDYSGYPDCRKPFLKAMEKAINLGTKQGLTKKYFHIRAPLVRYSKAAIIRMGKKLGVPFDMTWSCYTGGKKPCKVCDSCKLREQGFKSINFRRTYDKSTF